LSKGKHRWTQKESDLVWAQLTAEEKSEYNELVIGNAWGPYPANDLRLRELENLGFARLGEGGE
jgi:hypothetical protein